MPLSPAPTAAPSGKAPHMSPCEPIGALIGLDPFAPSCPEAIPCRVQDPQLWFGDRPSQLEKAKEFCLDCPARLACLRGAITRQEPWGVWGGEIFERGVIVARKRPRGRPRKTDRGVAA